MPRSLIACSIVALALGTPAFGQALTGQDTDAILNAAQRLGSATLTSQNDGDPLINGEIDGILYQIRFENCTANANCEDLNFFLGFTDLKPSLQLINDWNAAKRFSRAYLDQDRDACVEMDVDLVKGVSADYLDAQFDVWNLVLTQFTSHVGYTPN